MKSKLKVVYFGTPEFSVATLEALFHHPKIEIVSVVSMPDRPAGRGKELKSPEVIQFAKKYNLPYFQTNNINKESDFLKTLQDVDFFLVLAFAQFLSEDVLKLPLKGCFNIHTSLLPKYRGAAPIQYALLNDDQKTGVSIQKMVKEMDAGDLVLSHQVEITPFETAPMLSIKLKYQAALSTNDFINQLLEGTLTLKPQQGDISFAPIIKKEHGEIDFFNDTLGDIQNKLRAFDPWPGVYTFLNGKRLKVFSISTSHQDLKPGKAKNLHNQLLVGCKDGCLRLDEVQWEGKKRTTDSELLNGLRGELNMEKS